MYRRPPTAGATVGVGPVTGRDVRSVYDPRSSSPLSWNVSLGEDTMSPLSKDLGKSRTGLDVASCAHEMLVN